MNSLMVAVAFAVNLVAVAAQSQNADPPTEGLCFDEATLRRWLHQDSGYVPLENNPNKEELKRLFKEDAMSYRQTQLSDLGLVDLTTYPEKCFHDYYKGQYKFSALASRMPEIVGAKLAWDYGDSSSPIILASNVVELLRKPGTDEYGATIKVGNRNKHICVYLVRDGEHGKVVIDHRLFSGTKNPRFLLHTDRSGGDLESFPYLLYAAQQNDRRYDLCGILATNYTTWAQAYRATNYYDKKSFSIHEIIDTSDKTPYGVAKAYLLSCQQSNLGVLKALCSNTWFNQEPSRNRLPGFISDKGLVEVETLRILTCGTLTTAVGDCHCIYFRRSSGAGANNGHMDYGILLIRNIKSELRVVGNGGGDFGCNLDQLFAIEKIHLFDFLLDSSKTNFVPRLRRSGLPEIFTDFD